MKKNRVFFLIFCLFFFSHFAQAMATKKPVPEKIVKKVFVDVNKLADAIQKQYNSIKSATFDFEQTYKHPYITIKETSKGHVSYDKTTGNMMWDYQEPKEKQKKFFISGKKFTYYSVTDKLAYTHDCYDKDTLSASITFLLGTGSLKNSFVISALDGSSPNAQLSWLVLSPKEKNSPVSKLLLGVDQKSKVKESVVIDPSGGENHFKFTETHEKIKSSTFTFVPPPGVLVQPMPNVVCTESQKPKVKPQENSAKKPAMKKPNPAEKAVAPAAKSETKPAPKTATPAQKNGTKPMPEKTR